MIVLPARAGKRDRAPELMRGACAAPEHIIQLARGWIGTPYRHQMSERGVGCDCIGLVRGVWREVYGSEAGEVPVYTPDWAEVGAEERLIDGLGRFLPRVAVGEARPGDVLVFRMKAGALAKHAAILSEGCVGEARAKIVHAYWGHAVVESWLGPFWRRHVVRAFRFP